MLLLFYVGTVSSFPQVAILPTAPDSETTATTKVVEGQLVSLTCSVEYNCSSDLSVLMEYRIKGSSLLEYWHVVRGKTAYLYANTSVTKDRSKEMLHCRFLLRGNSSFGDSNIIEVVSPLPEVQLPCK